MSRRLIANLLLAALSVAACLGLIEALLRSGLLNDLSPYWIAPEYRELDARINQPNFERMRRHPFAFNAPVTAFARTNAERPRIIVLGDSFVWGKGLPYAEAWPRKFRKMLAHDIPQLEVVDWGRNGWSTSDKLAFLNSIGPKNLAADLAVVGFVVNDPDLRDHDHDVVRKTIFWDKTPLAPIRSVIPYTFDFFTGHIDAALGAFTDDRGYANWVDNHFWSEENLTKYLPVLRNLKAVFDAAGVPLLFVLTPANPNRAYYEPKYRRITRMLDDIGIPHVNLFDRIAAAFPGDDYGPSYRRLWANPADGHPGGKVTEVLAKGLYDHLKSNGFVERVKSGGADAKRGGLPDLPACTDNIDLAVHGVGFQRYPISDGETMLRVQGLAVERQNMNLRPIETVYVKLGDTAFAAMSPLPIRVALDGGKKVDFDGWFAVDIPPAHVGAASLEAIVVHTKSNCLKRIDLPQGLAPSDGMPPELVVPPTVPAAIIFSGN